MHGWRKKIIQSVHCIRQAKTQPEENDVSRAAGLLRAGAKRARVAVADDTNRRTQTIARTHGGRC